MVNSRSIFLFLLMCISVGGARAMNYETFCAVKQIQAIVCEEINKQSSFTSNQLYPEDMWPDSIDTLFVTYQGILLDLNNFCIQTPWGLLCVNTCLNNRFRNKSARIWEGIYSRIDLKVIERFDDRAVVSIDGKKVPLFSKQIVVISNDDDLERKASWVKFNEQWERGQRLHA